MPRPNIKAVKLPASTTRVLQTCDQTADKAFRREIRRTRDQLVAIRDFSWPNTTIEVKFAEAGHKSVASDVARKSFQEASIWPPNFQFMKMFDNSRPGSSPTHLIDAHESRADTFGALEASSYPRRQEACVLTDRIKYY